MRTYEITFLDFGFLWNPVFWQEWVLVGLSLWLFLTVCEMVADPEGCAKYWDEFPLVSHLLVNAIPVFFWPILAYISVKVMAPRIAWKIRQLTSTRTGMSRKS